MARSGSLPYKLPILALAFLLIAFLYALFDGLPQAVFGLPGYGGGSTTQGAWSMTMMQDWWIWLPVALLFAGVVELLISSRRAGA